MAKTLRLAALKDVADKRVLETGRFPVFAGDDPTAPMFVCGGCSTPLITGIPAGGIRELAGMSDGIECVMCKTVRAIPRH